MKCINKGKRTSLTKPARLVLCFILCAGVTALSGCAASPRQSFEDNENQPAFNFMVKESGSAETAQPFAADLCVADGDMITADLEDAEDYTSAALFDLSGNQTLYAQNIFSQVYPASLTKVMTALVALENASTDTVLTAGNSVYMSDADAQVAGLDPGDTMTLDQALHILLIYSANDVAVMIAENIGGTVENFISMMNDEAKRLGATGTNFINSNGLSDENHYTTAYDMYLIFNEALQYSTFNEIINMASYSTVYHSASGTEKEITVNSTNLYLQGSAVPPAGVTVTGGKTGTTNAAGHCLILQARDTSGRPYIAVVMKAYDENRLYAQMNELLGLIPGA